MKRNDEPDPGAPAWMLSLGDITMLLLCLFVMLVSVMTLERDRLDPGTAALNPPDPEREVDDLVEAILRQVRDLDGAPGATVQPIVIRDQVVGRLGREEMPRSQRAVFTIGVEWDAFDEGSFELRGAHYAILDAIKRWCAGTDAIVEVRGYTDPFPYDSLVESNGGWIPFAEHMRSLGTTAIPDDWVDRADFSMLAYRRARLVADYLSTRRFAGDTVIPAAQLRVEVAGPYGAIAPARDPRNRRVEVRVARE